MSVNMGDRERSIDHNSLAALVIPAFMDFSKEFNISLNKAAYLVYVYSATI